MFGKAKLDRLQVEEAGLRRRGDFVGALDVLDQMLTIDPGYSPALNNKAAILLMHRRYRDALPVSRAAVASDPCNGLALNNLGFCLLKTGSANEAVQALEGAIEAGYTHEGVRYNLGLAYLGAGRIDDGLDEWQKVLRSNPLNALVLQDLYRLAQAVGAVQPGQAALHESIVPRIKEALRTGELTVLMSKDGGEMMFLFEKS